MNILYFNQINLCYSALFPCPLLLSSFQCISLCYLSTQKQCVLILFTIILFLLLPPLVSLNSPMITNVFSLCVCVCVCMIMFVFVYMLWPSSFFFCGTRAWTQGLHLEPLYQPYFCEGFFEIGSCGTICPDWLWTSILLISASWVARL
jgi:hypothetical protein